MEEIPFTIVFRGVANVYSKEHAEDVIRDIEKNVSEELRDANTFGTDFGDTHYSLRNVTTKIGDDVYVDFRRELLPIFLDTEITQEIKGIVNSFLDSVAETLKKPPMFDRRDYIEVRKNILNEISILKGEQSWISRSQLISESAKRIEKRVRKDFEDNLKENIIRFVEGNEHA